jgi:predicted phage terminase large subunit-like protein
VTIPVSVQDVFDAGGLSLLDKLLAEKSLKHFVRVMWHTVEPKRKLVHGWVLDAICTHLESVTNGDITRLIINVAPGTMKSLLTSVFWPAWEWGPRGKPQHRFLCASYSQSLTVRDNGRFRQLIGSDLYKKNWGEQFTISEKDDSKVKIANDKSGWKLATSVGGAVTGERADRCLLDDPNSIQDAESDVIRASTNRWLMETLPTRLTDPAHSAIVVIQQRVHQEDATGTLLGDGDDWCHLCIPMSYDPDRHCTTSIGWTDPRSVEGEPCFPERFPPDVLKRDMAKLGPFSVAGQFQQMPAPRGGEILSPDWWQQWGPDDPLGNVPESPAYNPDRPIVKPHPFPPFSLVIGVLDGAYTTKEENDPSAMVVLGVFEDARTGYPQVMLVRAWTARLALHDLVVKVDQTAKKYRVNWLLVEAKASGISVMQELRRLFGLAEYGLVSVDPMGRDKVARAYSVAPLMADGLVWSPCQTTVDWVTKIADECRVFPKGAHDDQVDAIVHGLRWLRDQRILERDVEVKARESFMSRPVSRAASRPVYRT